MGISWGFSVKIGLDDLGVETRSVRVAPPTKKGAEIAVQEVREPLVDIFAEDDHTLVVAEMPGIGVKDVHLEVKEDLLSLYAARGEKRYRKEVLLPRSYPREGMKVSCNNGILKIKCRG